MSSQKCLQNSPNNFFLGHASISQASPDTWSFFGSSFINIELPRAVSGQSIFGFGTRDTAFVWRWFSGPWPSLLPPLVRRPLLLGAFWILRGFSLGWPSICLFGEWAPGFSCGFVQWRIWISSSWPRTRIGCGRSFFVLRSQGTPSVWHRSHSGTKSSHQPVENISQKTHLGTGLF